ncbi:MAG TPA: DUF58 domain-containing protein [Candidatus Marinimicrobia bacterium]|nr:DUF58 domain-containing protein [Candidatus Neomarinimicrobiota bacterium]HRS51934.1 DUF58 domain-containing protein [Candidatus Neomarinimicrobiota bacterium]HRU92943.1 DUF58 domain-containing protein [Candidatus Neomarinimicrobiota bacterium]
MAEERLDKRRYLEPAVIARLDNMALRARLVVEGFIIGLHRSPYHGFSIEFAEHRPYMPGDEIKYIDWKLYGKTDRFYIKEFEEETNLKSYIILDKSGSMGYQSGAVSKLVYGSYLAAALGYLLLKQQDAVSLTLFDTEITTYLPPIAKKSHLNLVLGALEKVTAGSETSIAPLLHSAAEKIKKRGLIILISDLLDDPASVINALKHFRHRRHEVIVFQVLDPQELEFGFNRQTKFVDLENRDTLLTEPGQVKLAYRQAINNFIEDYKIQCRANNIDHVLLTTDRPLDLALTEYLNKRARVG